MRYTKYITYILLLLLYGHFSSCSVEEEDQLLLSSSSGSFSTLGTVVNTEQLTIDSDTYGALLPVNTHIFTDNKVNILGQRVLLEVLFLDKNKQNNNSEAIIAKTKRAEIENEMSKTSLFSLPFFSCIYWDLNNN